VEDAPGEDGGGGYEEADGLIAVEDSALGFAAGAAFRLCREAFQVGLPISVWLGLSGGMERQTRRGNLLDFAPTRPCLSFYACRFGIPGLVSPLPAWLK
jgi:hypothetical protein